MHELHDHWGKDLHELHDHWGKGVRGTTSATWTVEDEGMTGTPVSAVDLLVLDGLLSEEEREIRSTVRRWLAEHVRPHVADWYERGEIPARELALGLGELGLLGMHLEGWDCAGTSATAYGLAWIELEAVDSGIRSLVSVQGSLAMFAIHHTAATSSATRGCPGWPPARRSAASV